jgi:hypothetical protein
MHGIMVAIISIGIGLWLARALTPRTPWPSRRQRRLNNEQLRLQREKSWAFGYKNSHYSPSGAASNLR